MVEPADDDEQDFPTLDEHKVPPAIPEQSAGIQPLPAACCQVQVLVFVQAYDAEEKGTIGPQAVALKHV